MVRDEDDDPDPAEMNIRELRDHLAELVEGTVEQVCHAVGGYQGGAEMERVADGWDLLVAGQGRVRVRLTHVSWEDEHARG